MILALALLCAPTAAPLEEPIETPIVVPSPIPVGFLVAWKPTILSVRIDSGAGSTFGSDKFQPLRGLFRYTTTTYGDRLLARAEIEGGRFQSDTQGTRVGTDGFDVTMRLLGGIATRVTTGFTMTASAGLITRYQGGSAADTGAPRVGIFGVTSNMEAEYRIAPLVTISAYVEGGLAPLPYASQPNLGVLSDASEFRLRLQVSFDIGTSTALDVGYDFTRWHASFDKSSVINGPGTPADQALLLEAREHAITIGVRWKP